VARSEPTERARRLGLCIECTAKPVQEGYAKCKRCRQTVKIRWTRRAQARNLRRRIAAAHKRALRAWIEAADLTIPPPQPPEYVPPKWYYVNRRQKYTKKSDYWKKPYVYRPRPLPTPPQVC